MTGKKHISAFTIIVSFVCLSIVGITLLPLLTVKLAPSQSLPNITVNFSMFGHTARIVEMEATSKLESMLSRIKGIRNLISTSGNGWGRIVIELDKHTSVDVARFEASTSIRQIWPELPKEVSYPLISVNRPNEETSRPFMTYTINSNAAPIVIQRYTENIIRSALNDIKGLNKIEVGGASPLEWQLEYDYRLLETVGVTVNDIRVAVSQYYTTQFLGITETRTLDDKPGWLRIILTADVENDNFDPAAITVSNKAGALIRLDQLVKVIHTERTPSGYYRINGLNSIYLSLTADESTNQLELSDKVKKKMEEIKIGLPMDYEIHTSYDSTDYIRAESRKIYLRSGLTVFMLLVFIFLFKRSLRYLFLITASLFVNLAIAIIFYYIFNLEIQLYSFAGITISLSLIIGNSINMIDHLLHKGNRNALMPITASTLTTVGVLSMIFFLDEEIRLNLQDFSAVMIINLFVSIIVAFLFVPALVEYMSVTKKNKQKYRFQLFSSARLTIDFTRLYERIIYSISRRKWIAFVCIVLLFGFPVFMMPEKVGGGTLFAMKYNEIVQNGTFKEKIKPLLNKTFGGTLRLFIQNVFQESYFTQQEETVLTISAAMPTGTPLSQLNNLIMKMERYLSGFSEIKQFQTSISSAQKASINIFFKDEHGSFPYRLKDNVINKALELGGGSWGVHGLQDQGFSNDVRDKAGNYRVKLYGYNYDELSAWADTLKNRLLAHRRIEDVLINSNFSKYKSDYEEFSFVLDKERLAAQGILPAQLFNSLQPVFAKDIWTASIAVNGQKENILLNSRHAQEYDIWALKNLTHSIGTRLYKLNQIATIERGQAAQEIGKENQQYRLALQYNYIGWSDRSMEILNKELEYLNKRLPMGYTAQKEQYSWGLNQADDKQYRLIGLLTVIIFLITSILFNSIKQPLVVIFIIPVSFIGIFLTFYWFELNFDQGGFASFILLSGLTVNASIYILNEYNRIRKHKPLLSPTKAYLKAWNSKVIPIFLTFISAIIGFIPFIINTQRESFWFPLAAGTIGGLIMSIIATWFFLPLLILKKVSK